MDDLDAVAVHEIDADGVAAEFILLDRDLIAEHQMEAVAALERAVISNLDAGGIPDDGVTSVVNGVALDHGTVGTPYPQAVAAPGDIELLSSDDVAADDAVARGAQVDTEQHVFERAVFDRGMGSEHANRGVFLVEVDARVPDCETAKSDSGGVDLHDIAAAASVEYDGTVRDESDRFGDVEMLGIDARRDLDPVAVLCGGDQLRDDADFDCGRSRRKGCRGVAVRAATGDGGCERHQRRGQELNEQKHHHRGGLSVFKRSDSGLYARRWKTKPMTMSAAPATASQ